MDGPEQEPPLHEGRQDDETPPRPPAWPYGLLIFVVTPVLVGAVGNFFPQAGCVFAGLIYLAELIGGQSLRWGDHDRLGRALVFAVVATGATVALIVLVIGGICMVRK
jgi:hypothetical protein